MTRPDFAVALTLLALPVLILTIGCGDSESDGYHEITASIDSLPTKAEVEGDLSDPSAGDAAETPGESPVDEPVAGSVTSEEPATPHASPEATGGDPQPVAPDDPQPSETAVAEGSTTPADPAAEPGSAVKPEEKPKREIKLLIPSKTFKVEGPGEAVRVSFDDVDLLKVLNMDPVVPKAPELMPDWLKKLDGKRVRIRGFMFPPFSETDIRAFTLARDTELCCFGRNPLPYDLIDVFLRKGAETDYIDLRPFDVVGVFHIGEEIEPGYLYSIDDAVVIQ